MPTLTRKAQAASVADRPWHFSRPPFAGAACVAVLLGACDQAPSGAPLQLAELNQLHAACVEAMVKSTCQVMTGPTASDAAEVVFIAGVGPVDAKAYRELRNSGDAMCGTVRNACSKDWDGPQCQTARGLWPSVAAAR